jgi:serine/threonine protein kinase
MVGTVFGRYVIENEIGHGGMGVVYCAHDMRLDRPVAIKVLGQKYRSHPAAWGLVLKEAQTACALNHPSICTIYDVGEEDGQPYIAMEYVEGCTLEKLLMPSGLTPTLLAYAARHITSALAHAHERGIIHRDIKSTNIIITQQGSLKILDFGLAKRIRAKLVRGIASSLSSSTERGSRVGNIHYWAPEILRGERANVWTDIWSLGVLLYEMATGTFPFTGHTAFELASAIMTCNPSSPPKRIPVWTSQVIARCLERNLVRRYRCAGDLMMDLPVEGFSDPVRAVRALFARFDQTETSFAGTTAREAGAA